MEKYTMFMDQKNQYSENEYTNQSNLQIQCNPYQATSHIFHRTRTNNFKICMEIQKKLKLPKQYWDRRMELEESICLTLGSTTKPQSSKQYGTEPSFLDNHLFTLWSSCVVKAIYSKHKSQDWILIFSNDLFSSLTWH